MPLKSTRVLHPLWPYHHRPVTEGFMEAEFEIYRDSVETEFNPETGVEEPVEVETIWSGQARVQQLKREQIAEAGEAVQPLAEYLIATPATLPPIRVGEGGDYGRVTVCLVDPQIVGRYLTIQRNTFGSLIWERDLYCMDDQARNNPKVGG